MTATDAPRTDEVTVVRREDWRPLPFTARSVNLVFDLHDSHAEVTATTTYERQADAAGDHLVLQGEWFELVSIALDGRLLSDSDYERDHTTLTLSPGQDSFTLTVVTRSAPQDNKTFQGLYRSGSTFCTQMEAEGFRRVTYFPDRPDVLAVWTTRVVADKARYPVLLSNGNLTESGDLPDGRHFTTWHDPFPKPSYLFALVAGNLAGTEDSFTTRSGKTVPLHIWVDPGASDRVAHAMGSLKRSMKWDEDVYGREYDLDAFHLVAVHDFNMGAMENKGLNIFNAGLVLAHATTATDEDFQRIEGVVAHEYFHNWTGNRVTCRDWFQLSLKEGLTVFRDQEFSADMNSRPVQRIADVRKLREMQFPEDAGPLSHPIRPDEYAKIDNFYTRTVYEKGAEVIRMLHALLGPEGFRKGTDLYFDRHDGQAVTCEDFVRALEDASGRDLTQFRRWYGQAGTPRLDVTGTWDQAAGTFALKVVQTTPPTPGQPVKQPFHIPLAMALLGGDGRDLPLRLTGSTDTGNAPTECVLDVTAAEQTFVFVGLDVASTGGVAPVPSLLREFSAPVRLEAHLDDEQLLFLASHDGDAFNRFESAQKLGRTLLLRMVAEHADGRTPTTPPALLELSRSLLDDKTLEPALAAEALVLPTESELAEFMEVADVDGIHAARQTARRDIAAACEARFVQVYESHAAATGTGVDATTIGHRSLKNVALGYLTALGSAERAWQQFDQSTTMTDQDAALLCLCDLDSPRRAEALASFRAQWESETLVFNKWFAAQAGSTHPDAHQHLIALVQDPAFDAINPNRARAVYATLSKTPTQLHRADGKGYTFLADAVLLIDKTNPIIAGRMAGAFAPWRRYDEGRKALMHAQLQRLHDAELSDNVREIVTRVLAG